MVELRRTRSPAFIAICLSALEVLALRLCVQDQLTVLRDMQNTGEDVSDNALVLRTLYVELNKISNTIEDMESSNVCRLVLHINECDYFLSMMELQMDAIDDDQPWETILRPVFERVSELCAPYKEQIKQFFKKPVSERYAILSLIRNNAGTPKAKQIGVHKSPLGVRQTWKTSSQKKPTESPHL